MDPSQSAKRPRLSVTEKDELDRVLTDAFPDDVERADNIYGEAVDDPRLAKEILQAARLPRAERDLKGAVERAYKLWQTKLAEEAALQRQTEEAALQKQATGVINQRADITLDLRRHALKLIQTDPAFVDSVLRLPTDKHLSLQELAKEVDGKAASWSDAPGAWLMWAGRSGWHHLPG